MTKPILSPSFRNGHVSHWVDSLDRPARRAPLRGPVDVDVAIVGAGYTGLWTGYYLKQARPDLEIAIIEREFAGFGASGRNGGWLSAEPAGKFRHYARVGGVPAALELQRHMFDAVEEAIGVARREGFAGGIAHDGLVSLATSPAQLARLRGTIAAMRAEGWDGDHLVELGPGEVRERVNVDGALGGYWTRHCARIHPARFVFGLADAVERRGVRIYEDTTALAIEPRRVRTDRGDVRAPHVIQALEGYTGSLPDQRRRLLPMNSSMVVTEPLTERQREAVGWRGGELVGDLAHSFAYVQRTADWRIAIGGRGVPYNAGSSFSREGRTAPKAVGQLAARLRELFPGLAGVRLEHTWSGVLGVPRDWSAGVSYDPATGLGFAGGYVGHGVTATNLAARTLRDLVLGERTDLTRLPWVGHRARNWEPEPLRWLGAATLYAAYRYADRREYATGRETTHPAARVADVLSGRR